MGKIILATVAIALASGILAVGRIGGEIVADVAIFVFLAAVFVLALLLASYLATRQPR